MVEQLTQMSAKLADAKMTNAELRDEVNRLKHELRDADARSSPVHNHSRQQSADATLIKRVCLIYCMAGLSSISCDVMDGMDY